MHLDRLSVFDVTLKIERLVVRKGGLPPLFTAQSPTLKQNIIMTVMDGVLIIDKPAGITSHDVVARVRKILGERRIGHTGTLDPFATGVLVALVGRATRLAQFLSGAEKEYEAMIRLGYATDTGDLTGTRLPPAELAGSVRSRESSEEPPPTGERPVPVTTDEAIESAIDCLRGEIDQVPPMYSAKKHQGRKLYELARRGEEIERAAVRITVHEFETVRRNSRLLTRNEDATSDLAVRVVCSAGTYIRTLAEDLGRRCGVGAHLVALRRTRAGDFGISDAVSLETLQQAVANHEIEDHILSTDAALSRLPFLHLTAADAARTRNGMQVSVDTDSTSAWLDGERVRMRDEGGSLIAIGVFDAAGRTVQPRVVLAEIVARASRP
ncbi:MAG: tRNA pseudouridine(55) synthase TruB [Acidobacteriota bacterium]|nr:tRNA pseudouridine(55) synthase TruB [Acidobacteriota bacterium]